MSTPTATDPRCQILWANFEKLVCLTDRHTARQVTTDLEWASRQSRSGMNRVMIAEQILHQLEDIAVPISSADDLREMSDGQLFVFTGVAWGKGFGSIDAYAPEAEQSTQFADLRIRGTNGHALGRCRYSHALVASIGNLSDPSFGKKYIMGTRAGCDRYIPLAAGVMVGAFGDEDDSKSRYRPLSFKSAEDFADFAIQSFAREVESGRLWRLVADQRTDGFIQGEDKFQFAFEAACNLVAQFFDVSVDPQPHHGSGEVDICLSRGGSDVCCLELKLASNARLEHGLRVQLPAYMNSKGTTVGRYVILVRDGDPTPSEVSALLASALHALPDEINIKIVTVDGRSRPSASKQQPALGLG